MCQFVEATLVKCTVVILPGVGGSVGGSVVLAHGVVVGSKTTTETTTFLVIV